MSEPKPEIEAVEGRVLRCSFCSKSQAEVNLLIVGPDQDGHRSFICDDCVVTCVRILGEHAGRGGGEDEGAEGTEQSDDGK